MHKSFFECTILMFISTRYKKSMVAELLVATAANIDDKIQDNTQKTNKNT